MKNLIRGVITAFSILTGSNLSAQAETRQMDVETAYDLASNGQIQLIDIRTPSEWEAIGVPAYAATVQLQAPDFVSTIKDKSEENPDTPIALICRSGGRSARAIEILEKAGIQDLINVYEGVEGKDKTSGWINKGLPLQP
jgi:rhodanese-related sulfurtransferase